MLFKLRHINLRPVYSYKSAFRKCLTLGFQLNSTAGIFIALQWPRRLSESVESGRKIPVDSGIQTWEPGVNNQHANQFCRNDGIRLAIVLLAFCVNTGLERPACNA